MWPEDPPARVHFHRLVHSQRAPRCVRDGDTAPAPPPPQKRFPWLSLRQPGATGAPRPRGHLRVLHTHRQGTGASRSLRCADVRGAHVWATGGHANSPLCTGHAQAPGLPEAGSVEPIDAMLLLSVLSSSPQDALSSSRRHPCIAGLAGPWWSDR